MQNKKAPTSPAVIFYLSQSQSKIVHTKVISQHNVQINQLTNPHQKMEGIQKVNKEDIKKLIDKAQKMPNQSQGDFVKVQSYQFTIDEVSDDEGDSKYTIRIFIKKKKRMTQSKMIQSKINKKQEKGKSQEKKEEPKKIDSLKAPKIIPKLPENKQTKLLAELAKLRIPNKTKQEDYMEKIYVNIEPNNNEIREQDEKDQVEQQEYRQNCEDEDQEENLNEDIVVSSQVSDSKVSEKKYQSSMARLMQEMMGESIIEEVQTKDEIYDIPGFDEQQKQYLKTIKQYQKKIKQLNNQLYQIKLPQQLPIIVEVPESIQDFKKEEKPINIYQEFIQHSEIEKQFKNLKKNQEATLIEYEQKIQQQQIQMEILETKNKEKLAQMEKHYVTQMKNMQQKVKRYEALALNQIKRNKLQQNEEILSIMSSNISAIVQDKELLECDYNMDPEVLVDEIENEQKNFEKKIKIYEADIDSEIQSLTSGIESILTKREISELNKKIKTEKFEYDINVNESSIGDVIDEDDQLHFIERKSQISSSIGQFQNSRKRQNDTDSRISKLIQDDSELFIEYQNLQSNKYQEDPNLFKKSSNKQKFDLDSDISQLIDQSEVEDLLKQDNFSQIDSNLSVSDIVSLGKVKRILKDNKKYNYEQMNSDINSIISQNEVDKLKEDPLYNDMESQETEKDMYDSLIDSIVSRREKEWLEEQDVYQKINSDIDSDNEAFDIDPKSSFYLNLAEQLERDNYVPQGEKLDIFRRIMIRAKQQYMVKLKLKKKQPQPNQLTNKDSQSSYQYSQITSNVNQSINSVISVNEQLQLDQIQTIQQQIKQEKDDQVQIKDINSSIGSIISKDSQQMLLIDSQMKLINSQITEQKNQSFNHSISDVSDVSKQSNRSHGSQGSQISKNSIFNFLSYKRDTVTNLQKQVRQPSNQYI